MFRKKPLSDAVRVALGVGVGTLAFGASSGALAQDDVIEEIITTGSRIPIDANLVTSSPVTTLDAAELSNRGIIRVEDLINDMPQMVPEFTANDSNGSTGTATLDLRGLGSDRTLVLVNGHRMGFGDPFALAPDLNQIPGALVERVEILTGGASSTYGSDAVSGVVNFIMKDNFEGFQIDYQYSGYQHSNDNSVVQAQINSSGFALPSEDVTDGGSTYVNVLLGVNSADDNGNITAYLGYRDTAAIFHADRDFSACALSSRNGETCAGSATIPTGTFSPLDGTGVYFTVAGDQFIPWDYTYYNYGPLNHFQRPDERYTAGLFGHYAVSEAFEGYAEVMFMDDRSLAQIAPSGNFFRSRSISCDNPLLSAQQAATINGVDVDGVAGPDFPCVPGNGDVVPWRIGRRNVEGGPRFDDLRHTTYRTLVGIRGDINDNWSYDVSANFSRLVFSEVYNNDLSITNLVRALDVVDDGAGNFVCATFLNGADPNCVPWNIFQEGGVTQAALDYIKLPLFADGDLSQDQWVGFVSGDLGVAVPWAADTIQVVAGFEYRDDQLDFNPDTGFTSGDGAGQGGATGKVDGAIVVKEFFTEAKIPIVQDRSGIQSLSLDLRYRYSDYDSGITTDTYNIGGEWTPMDGLMIRGGFSRAVRAANIRELFRPQSFGLWSGTDPCAGPTPELTAAACANTGVTAAQYGGIPFSPAGQYNRTRGGNTALIPETSDSITIGVVWSPEFVQGLDLSVDYWSIEVLDAVAAGIGEEFAIRQCAATGLPVFCSLITRGAGGNLWVTNDAFVTSTNINIGFFDVSGIDIVANYGFEFGDGHTMDLALRGSILDKYDQQPLPGAAIQECAGFWGGDCGRPRPEWKHTFSATWGTPWDLDVTGGWRYIGKADGFETITFHHDEENYFDLVVSYTTELFGGTTVLNAGASNLFDNDPPVNGFVNNAAYSNGNTFPGTYDALGRYFFLGFTMSY